MHRGTRLRKRDIIVAAGCVVIVLALLYLGAQWLEDRNAKPEPRGDYRLRFENEQLTVNGVTYRQRPNLTTILLMGIDQDSDETRVMNYRNGGQADFLRLIVIDPTDKVISQVAIDRDTMTPIAILGVLGNRSGTRTLQICLSHSFGDGKEQSCELTVEAVSNLLFNVPIKYYVAMNLDGISVLNDSVGGVTVTLEDDFSHIDPSMAKGATMTLVGDQAEIFVRSRMSMEVGTNEARMKRQQTYISRMLDKLNESVHASSEFAGTLYDGLSPYLITNMSRAQIVTEAWNTRDYQRRETLEPKGEHTISSDEFMEFHADEESLAQIVLELFYQPMK